MSVLVLGFFMFLSAVFARFSLILCFSRVLEVDWEGRLGVLEVDWEGRLGVLVRNLRTVKVVYWVLGVLVPTHPGCAGYRALHSCCAVCTDEHQVKPPPRYLYRLRTTDCHMGDRSLEHFYNNTLLK